MIHIEPVMENLSGSIWLKGEQGLACWYKNLGNDISAGCYKGLGVFTKLGHATHP